jgi:hypothetical protein
VQTCNGRPPRVANADAIEQATGHLELLAVALRLRKPRLLASRAEFHIVNTGHFKEAP